MRKATNKTSGIGTEVAAHSGGYFGAVRIPADHDLMILSGTPGLRPTEHLSKTQ
jgi:hypothetical protein